MVVALKPLHDAATIRRVVVSTYQAISGAGAAAIDALRTQRVGENDDATRTLGGQLDQNLLMHWTPGDHGYQEEELKLVHETRKILGDPTIAVSPTCVRVPVVHGHSESLTIETQQPLTAAQAIELLRAAPGIEVVDDGYPQPIAAAGEDAVFVGRIRDDIGNPGGIQMWVVADNIRKGAALNAVQIAEAILL